jgi:nitrogen-specific signal transduction histidine kinase
MRDETFSAAVQRTLRAALDASTQALIVIGRDGAVILSNPAAQQLGISLEKLADELIPHRPSMIERGEGTIEIT